MGYCLFVIIIMFLLLSNEAEVSERECLYVSNEPKLAKGIVFIYQTKPQLAKEMVVIDCIDWMDRLD